MCVGIVALASCHGTYRPIESSTSISNTSNVNSNTGTTSGIVISPEDLREIGIDENKEYNLEFWAKNDSDVTQQNVYKKAVESFNEYYPNIHITIRNYSDYVSIFNDVTNNVATNTTPNISIAYPDHVATYLDGDLVQPLEQFIYDEDYGLGGSKVKYESINKEDIVEKFYKEGVINNKTYLLPFMRSTEALYINKNYVESLGFTIPDMVSWDWIWEVAQKGRDERTDTNFYPFIYKSTDNMFIQLCKQYDYDFTNDRGENLFFSNDVANMLLNIADKYNKKLFSTFKKVSYPGNHMNVGNCIFAVDSTAGSTWIGSNCPNVDSSSNTSYQYETVVRIIPQVDVNNPIMISQGPSVCVFKKTDDDVVTASWLFAQYLLNKETQLAYCKTEGYSPVLNSIIESDEYKNYLSDETEYSVKRAATKLVSDNRDKTFITSVFNGSTKSREAAGYLIEAMSAAKYQTVEGINNLYDRAKNLYKIN